MISLSACAAVSSERVIGVGPPLMEFSQAEQERKRQSSTCGHFPQGAPSTCIEAGGWAPLRRLPIAYEVDGSCSNQRCKMRYTAVVIKCGYLDP